MYLITKEVELKDVIAFEYGNVLILASKADAEVGDEDSVVIVERNIIGIRIEDEEHFQAG